MNRRVVFIDTWAWIATTVRRDEAHLRVRKLGLQMQRDGALWVTSNAVGHVQLRAG